MDEFKRRYRVIDQMLSMHSMMRDKFSRISLIFDVIVLLVSTLLVATVFIDSQYLLSINIDPLHAKTIIGICSILVFIASLLQLRIDWKQRSVEHSNACYTLSNLKSKMRILANEIDDDSLEIDVNKRYKEIFLEYDLLLNSTPPIPDKLFNRLKSKHKKKVAISKLIDDYPLASYYLICIIHTVISNYELIKIRRNRNNDYD